MPDFKLNELRKFFPFLDWFNAKTKKALVPDTIAGIVVALILIPQSIAYAQLAGLPPQMGLYAAFVGPIVAALFGSSTKLSTGPVAVISLITASAFSALNITDIPTIVEYTIFLAVMVGLIQLLFGLLRLGVIVNFISHPVMLGFSNAAAIIIATSQLPKVFGVKVGNFEHHYETMADFITSLPDSFHLLSLIFAVCAIGTIIILKKIHPLIPGVLIVMALSTILSWGIGYEQIGGSIVGSIPPGIPRLSWVNFDLSAVPVLISTAFVISILGFMESFSIGKSLALKSGEKVNANQEFIGQGLANIASAALQGYPISGSFSRSAVNFQAGAQTGISSVVAGLCVLITLLFFTPLLYHLPQSVLSAIIITSVITLINLEKLKDTFRIIRSDGLIAIITFITTLFFAPHLDKGILIGISLSMAYYIYTRTKPHIGVFTTSRSGKLIEINDHAHKQCNYISILSFDGSLFFANAAYLEGKITSMLAVHNKHIRYIILDAQGINFLDTSGIEALENIIKSLHELKIELVFVRVKEDILTTTKNTELYSFIKRHQFESRTNAIRAIYAKAHHEVEEPSCPLHKLLES